MASSPPTPPRHAEQPQLDERTARHKLRNGLISLAILVAVVTGLLLTVPGLHGVAHELARMAGGWLAFAVALEILSCLAYVVAFLQVFDRAPLRFGARVALSELAFQSAVSLGGLGGAAVGAWVMVERGGQPVRVAQRSAVLFLLTSAVNAITLAVVGIAAFFKIMPGSHNPLLTLLPAAVAVAAMAVVAVMPRFSDSVACSRAPGRVRTIATQTALAVRDTERLLRSPDWRIVGAIGYLWFDIGVLIACFAAAGTVPPLAVIVLAYQVGYLSNLIPVPGNIGILDGSLVGMFVLYGVSATTATAATLVYHAIALWIPAMWGTLAFLLLQRSRGKPLVLRPPREERSRAASG